MGLQEQDKHDQSQDTGFLRSTLKLPEKPEATVRFFQRDGSNDTVYYSVCGPDAALAVRDHFVPVDALRTWRSGSTQHEYCCLSKQAFELFTKHLLLVKQHRVEVYAELGGRSGGKSWSLVHKGSPGNFSELEEIVFSQADANVTSAVVGVAVTEKNLTTMVGIAYVSVSDLVIQLLEFTDNEHYSQLESALVQLAPKEAVVFEEGIQSAGMKRLFQIFSRNNIATTESRLSECDDKLLHQDVSHLVRPVAGKPMQFGSHSDSSKVLACKALSGLIKYMQLKTNEDLSGKFRIDQFNMHLYVKMDSAACTAMELIDNQGDGRACLVHAIDRCRTPQGHRLLARYLKQPLLDKETLEERLDLVEAFVQDTVLRKTFHDDLLRRIPDCQMLARKLLKNRATLPDCYKGYRFCVIRNLYHEALAGYDGDKATTFKARFIESFTNLEEEINKFCTDIESTMDLVAAEKGIFVVRSDIDETLKELWQEMNEVEDVMGEETYKVAKTFSLEANKSLKLESNNQHGHFFRVTMKDEQVIRGSSTFRILDSNKGGVRFRNDLLEKLSGEYWSKRQEYEEKQKEFVHELLQRCSDYGYIFESLNSITAELDVTVSFAIAAVENTEPYVRPKLLPLGSGNLNLVDLRHPCVELQQNRTFIPNSISFTKDEASFYIVTGPNMGGKSTFLRSVGVAVLLAQVGSFVPASEATISIVDAILARVGAGDALQKGISTFMAEMLESSYILQVATQNSLVLIDELGRGTSTYDGFGLCYAISKYLLTTVNCFSIVATHFHRLTELADESKSVRNVHFLAIAQDSGLQMMHKIEPGSCDRSFGIHVAKLTEFPVETVMDAQKIVDALEVDVRNDVAIDDDSLKSKQQERKEGYETIDQVLSEIKNLCDKGSSESEFQSKLAEIQTATKNSSSPFLQRALKSWKLNSSEV